MESPNSYFDMFNASFPDVFRTEVSGASEVDDKGKQSENDFEDIAISCKWYPEYRSSIRTSLKLMQMLTLLILRTLDACWTRSTMYLPSGDQVVCRFRIPMKVSSTL